MQLAFFYSSCFVAFLIHQKQTQQMPPPPPHSRFVCGGKYAECDELVTLYNECMVIHHNCGDSHLVRSARCREARVELRRRIHARRGAVPQLRRGVSKPRHIRQFLQPMNRVITHAAAQFPPLPDVVDTEQLEESEGDSPQRRHAPRPQSDAPTHQNPQRSPSRDRSAARNQTPAHINDKSIGPVVQPRMAPGLILTVCKPHKKSKSGARPHITDAIPSENILSTAGSIASTQYYHDKGTHCFWFWAGKRCRDGAACKFIHALRCGPVQT